VARVVHVAAKRVKSSTLRGLPAGSERSSDVRAMFASIAPRYDLMNRLMTLGLDRGWRREVVRRAALAPRHRVLDLGTGTGDLALESLGQMPGVLAVGADFTPEMMRVGRSRVSGGHVRWVVADALRLPFARGIFAAVTSGYLLRNVADIAQSLREQHRVLCASGRVVCLDTTPPPRNVLRPLVLLHLRVIIPLVGRLVTGDPTTYAYLQHSTEAFLSAERIAACLRAVGFREVGFARRMLGTMAIHWGVK